MNKIVLNKRLLFLASNVGSGNQSGTTRLNGHIGRAIAAILSTRKTLAVSHNIALAPFELTQVKYPWDDSSASDAIKSVIRNLRIENSDVDQFSIVVTSGEFVNDTSTDCGCEQHFNSCLLIRISDKNSPWKPSHGLFKMEADCEINSLESYLHDAFIEAMVSQSPAFFPAIASQIAISAHSNVGSLVAEYVNSSGLPLYGAPIVGPNHTTVLASHVRPSTNEDLNLASYLGHLTSAIPPVAKAELSEQIRKALPKIGGQLSGSKLKRLLGARQPDECFLLVSAKKPPNLYLAHVRSVFRASRWRRSMLKFASEEELQPISYLIERGYIVCVPLF